MTTTLRAETAFAPPGNSLGGLMPFATEGSTANFALQPRVALAPRHSATLGGVNKNWANHWKTLCAPKVRNRKHALGRAVPEKEVAAYVEVNSGKNTKRGLVSLWVSGAREPYISQFLALCDKLDLDPHVVLSVTATHKEKPLRRVNESAKKGTAPSRRERVGGLHKDSARPPAGRNRR